MKKGGVVILSLLVISLFMTSFVFAITCADCGAYVGQKFDQCIALCVDAPDTVSTGDSSFSNALNTITASINPVTKLIIGDVEGGDAGLLLIKFLFWIILLALIYFAVRKVPNLGESTFATWLITLALSLISIRYFSTAAIINFIWLPQGVFGVVVATLLPFILFLFFIESFNNSIIRKVGWTTFGVVYVMLALLRWDSLKITSKTGLIGGIGNLGWFYLAIGVFSLLAILLDRKFRSWVILSSLKKKTSRKNLIRVQRILEEIDEWQKVAASTSSEPAEITKAQKEIDKLNKQIAAIKS